MEETWTHTHIRYNESRFERVEASLKPVPCLVRTTTILEQDKQLSLTLLAEGAGCCTYDSE